MKYALLPIIIFLFWSCTNDSLTYGHVYNKNKQPIDSVKILVSGSDIYTYSDKQGYFEIDTKNLSKELLFDKKGYKLKFEKLSENNSNLEVILKIK